jgi:hypothetical protein
VDKFCRAKDFEMNAKWAPIVYARTLDIDYRWIVVPDDFSDDEIRWAEAHVHAATRVPDRFRQEIRWVAVRGNCHFLVGVNCAASLFSENSRDRFGRSLDLFAGFVSVAKGPDTPLAQVSNFSSLYNFVERRWEDRVLGDSQRETYNLSPDLLSVRCEDPGWNVSTEKVAFWPAAQNETLWAALGNLPECSSCCLNFPAIRNFEQMVFLNLSILDLSSKEIITKPVKRDAPAPVVQTAILKPPGLGNPLEISNEFTPMRSGDPPRTASASGHSQLKVVLRRWKQKLRKTPPFGE